MLVLSQASIWVSSLKVFDGLPGIMIFALLLQGVGASLMMVSRLAKAAKRGLENQPPGDVYFLNDNYPAKRIFGFAALNGGYGIIQLLGYRADLKIVYSQYSIFPNYFANGGDNGGRAGAESFF